MCLYKFKSMVSIMRYVILLMTPIPYMDHSLVMVKGHSVQFSSVAQSCPTLCDPMNWSPPGSSVHGDLPGKDTGVSRHATCLLFPCPF